MAKDILPPTELRMVEMDGYIHCWHQCGPTTTYASLSKDISPEEIRAALDRFFTHVRECTGIYFPMAGDMDG